MITGSCLINAIISGANNINNNKDMVDRLNIFPVPDGDTGSNMSMTISSAGTELLNCDENVSIAEVAKTAASSMLRGARGNSGVILSLLFKGFAKGLADLNAASGKDLLNALSIGVESAYNAVMKPMEGTILTVARIAYEKGTDAAFFNPDPIFVWEAVCNGANEALQSTPDLLPVLKKAGVVDAGGKGLCLIFEGMLSVFKYNKVINANAEPKDFIDGSVNTAIFESAIAKFDDVINFTYCTEFIVEKSAEDLSISDARAYLETIGDCVVVVEDEEIIKVHVHTESPGLALQEGLKYGQLITVKVENMKEQNKNAKKQNQQKLPAAEPTEEYGFVAVATGGGLISLFKDLGCNQVVSGGQSMNPSTEDIFNASMATQAKTVFVFPNNKNIILAAEQAVNFAKDRKIMVVPTKTIPQGMSAILAFDSTLPESEMVAHMTKCASLVKTGQVTFASRDAEYGGFKIKEGEILALADGKLTFKSKDPVKAAIRLASSLANRSSEFITIIYGESISDKDAQLVLKNVQKKYPHADISLVNGGQEIYHFILSVE
ncbi:MAG: DAK2 domain-containing protein [Clostridia bacterium]|nr:DAK2 domain-containing protein [Clostridia bacterium]